jgi:basic membrane protein A
MKASRTALAALAALSIVAVSCGSDKKESSSTTATTAAGSTATTTAGTAGTTVGTTGPTTAGTTAGSTADTTAGTEGPTTTGPAIADFDTNGDGKVIIGVATPGPRNDGAYYQALVDGVTAFSKANSYADPVIVDNIKPEEAAAQLDGLARQNVDMIAVGAGEIADPLPDLTKKYAKVVWYCNCGAGFAPQPNLIQSGDDGSEINYSAGVATALLMKAKGVTKAAMIGNNNFNFEKESFGAFRLGLDSVDKSYAWTYVATGSFNDVSAATEAFNNLKDQGVGAIYPYLGGSHEAVVKLSDENKIITMSAGAANACERTDLTYDIAIKFDSGLYVKKILEEIKSGKIHRGQTRVFHVGVDPEVGAVICKPTADQTAAMDAAYKLIASGDLAEAFGKNKAQAYAT